ncbi:MAG: hypothetical protein RMM16_08735 [Chloroherpetonaceae bacterium]|nr:hypothetical protein [Chloroherpetonaceae bacterium]
MHVKTRILNLTICVALGLFLLAPAALLAQKNDAPAPIELYGATFRLDFQPSGIDDIDRLELVEPRFADIARAAIHRATPFASRLVELCDSLNFPDWLRLKLVGEIAKRSAKKNNQKTFAAMVLLRAMGYDAAIVLLSKQWRLAIEIDQKIFFATLFEESKRRYAIYDIEKGELMKATGESDGFYDANENLGQTLEPLALFQDGLPNLPFKPIERKITWKFEGENYSLAFALNRNLVRYLESRPQVDVALYFNESVSRDVVQAVIEPLKRIIAEKGFSPRRAVAFLHSFVLNGFAYKDDMQTSRGQHVNSPHETLASEFSDCEDRAILLSALIRGALGYEVVGIEFPNHISLAVHYPDFVAEPGDEVYLYEGKRFLSSDPSCFGALGSVNPDFKGKTPIRFIRVEPLAISGANY